MFLPPPPQKQKNAPGFFTVAPHSYRAKKAIATTPDKTKVAAPLRLAPAVTTGLDAEPVAWGPPCPAGPSVT
jgi:hypothetical protein